MSEATTGEHRDRSLEDIADDIASNENFSEPVRRMARIVRDGKREGRC